MEEESVIGFKTFLEQITEHDNGTYVCVNLRRQMATDLANWVKANVTAPKLVPSTDLHATVIYSRVGCPGVVNENFGLPYTARITEWMILGDEAKCLCLGLDSPQLVELNRRITEQYGATSDYDQYTPHVTIAYDYEGEIPTKLPKIKELIFNTYKIEGLKPDWRPE